jgi:uncharacterized protein
LAVTQKIANLPVMAERLTNLPEGKRAELTFVVETVRAGFAFATERRSTPELRNGKLLKILLFGSYARGDWVEDPVGRYFSDYDLLVVVDHDELTDFDVWERTDRQLIDEVATGTRLRTPVSLNVHSLADVNEKLRLGRYFFIDAVRDGIMLFEEPGHPFAKPQPLTAAEALRETRDYFEEWFEGGRRFYQNAIDNTTRGWLKEAAFLLHQAAERAYHCFILTSTLYSPLCRARHKGDYAERRTMPMPGAFPPAMRRLGELRAA